MFTIKKLVATLVMPLPVSFLLLILGLLLYRAGRRRSGIATGGAGILVLLLASWAPVADGLLRPLEQRHTPVAHVSQHPGVERIVVLGSSYHPDWNLPITSQLGDSAVVRLIEGIRLYRQLPEATLIVSGGPVFGEGAVARGYATLALALGVADKDLIVLDEPRDTASEARAVAEAVGSGQRLFLVTSASHMDRSMRHFRRAGLDPIAAPTRHKALREDRTRLDYWVPAAGNLHKTERALYEYMGLLAVGLDH